MKRISLLFFVCAYIVLLPLKGFAQENNFTPHIDVGAKLSTNGVGVEGIYRFHPKFNVKLGYELMSLGVKINQPKGTNFPAEGKVDYWSSAITLFGSYSFYRNFYVSAGLGVLNFHPTAKVYPIGDYQFGDITIGPDIIGEATFDVKSSWSIAPYVGIGHSFPVSKSGSTRLGVELGTYYMGKPKLTVNASGMLSPTNDPDHIAYLEDHFSSAAFLPVLKLSLSFKVASLTK